MGTSGRPVSTDAAVLHDDAASPRLSSCFPEKKPLIRRLWGTFSPLRGAKGKGGHDGGERPPFSPSPRPSSEATPLAPLSLLPVLRVKRRLSPPIFPSPRPSMGRRKKSERLLAHC